MRVKELFAFMQERQSIYIKKTAGKPKPWTRDPIMQKYKFCNIYRELDRTTVWLRKNWREPHQDDLYLWFAMIVARFLNNTEALGDLGYCVPWNHNQFVACMSTRMKRGEKVFWGAYNSPNCIGETGVPKHISFSNRLFTPLWRDRDRITNDICNGGTLASAFQVINAQWALGSFMTGQVIADLKFTPRWKDAPDWWTFAVPGPGSRRGLNRVFNKPTDWKLREELWLSELKVIQRRLDPLIEKAGMLCLSAQDLQGCLCEFDKYERTRLGEGRPRSKYSGV